MSPLHILEARQRPDGAWGYRDELPGTVEPTALATLALSLVDREGASRGRDWLLARQRPDGSWPHSREVPGSSWMTAPAVLALAAATETGADVHIQTGAAVHAGAKWLREQAGEGEAWHVRLRRFLLQKETTVELDPTLEGWPWLNGTFSWVEPTAWALLALKTVYTARPGRRVEGRLREGEKMIVDRMCPGGGWNAGNSRVLGFDLEPYADTTALALIGLQAAHEDTRPAIEESLGALGRMLERNDSVLTLALSLVALTLHERPTGSLRSQLGARCEEGRAELDTRSLALASIALADAGAAFRVKHSPVAARAPVERAGT